MRSRLERALVLARAVVREARAENLTFMAGSIAYHAFVSLLPLFALVLAVLTFVGSTDLAESVLALVDAVLTRGASSALVAELRAASRSTGLSLLGGAVLLWGTLRVFRGLDTAFSDIYESGAENTVLDQFGDGLLVLVTVAVALLFGAAVHDLLPAGSGAGPALLGRVALLLVLAVALYPMYYVFPDVSLDPLEAVPGVLVAAVGLTTAHALFRLYVELSARRPGRSVVAGILVFLTWLYVSGFVVLLGAVVNAVLSNRSRDVSVDPVVGGVAPDAAADREAVVASLARLERLLDDPDAGDVVVEVGDERVRFPRPDGVATRTERSRVFADDVSLDLRWSPRE